MHKVLICRTRSSPSQLVAGLHYQKVAVRTILVQPCTYAKVDLRLFEPFEPSQGVHKVAQRCPSSQGVPASCSKVYTCENITQCLPRCRTPSRRTHIRRKSRHTPSVVVTRRTASCRRWISLCNSTMSQTEYRKFRPFIVCVLLVFVSDDSGRQEGLYRCTSRVIPR